MTTIYIPNDTLTVSIDKNGNYRIDDMLQEYEGVVVAHEALNDLIDALRTLQQQKETPQ